MKTVLVIGAGTSGLAAIKCCLDEGLQPTCFEKGSNIGGLWYFTEKVEKGRASVMRSTVTNVSKEMMCFSDFPPCRETSIYMHNKDVLEYFQLYADKFNLMKYIRLNTEVVSVCENDETGCWNVTIKDGKIGQIEELVFDTVLVCTGLYTMPSSPQFQGLDEFQGQVRHTHDYKENTGCAGTRALVIGIGNSAVDVAVDLSSVADQVFLSTRSGAWIMGRVSDNGDPLDMMLSRFLGAYLLPTFPKVFAKFLENKLNKKVDHQRYGLCPKHSVSKGLGLVNDDLPVRLLTGAVKIRPDIECFTKNGVKFIDGTVENIDTVVLGTGYTVEYPFFHKNVVPEDLSLLYKAVFPPDRRRHTLAMIGSVRARGPVPAIVEMQCRLATRVFKDLFKLPSKQEMWASINQRIANDHVRRISPSCRIVVENYPEYTDELATMVGCKPSLSKLLLTDWRLARTCMFGPCTPYQFRLMGPGSWAGAREAIMSQLDRTYYPLRSGREIQPRSQVANSGRRKFIFISVLLLAFFMYFIV